MVGVLKNELIIDLPKLEKITLGIHTLEGKKTENSFLIMNSIFFHSSYL